MSVQRTRPMDTLQRIVSSFKQFEKKLDKLQDDVKYHGHTLSELRVMVANLSNGNMINPDTKTEEPKRFLNKTTTMQSDERNILNEQFKKKRKNNLQPLSSKMPMKSSEAQKYGIRPSKDPLYRMNKMPIIPKAGLGCKRSIRQRKSDAPRRTTAFQKEKQKKRTSAPQQF